MKIDLHVHARERSTCAVESEESQIQAAIAAGLDGIAFTDHHLFVLPNRMEFLRKKYAPFKIFTGIEVSAGREDWLVIGVYDTRLENRNLTYPDLWRMVFELGAFIALAHPFRITPCINVDLSAYPPHGIEVRSNNTPASREAEIRAIAGRHHLRLLQNSDAHTNTPLGQYFNDLPEVLDGDRDLVRLLKSR